MQLLVNFYANVTDQSVNDLIKFITLNSVQQAKSGNPIEEIIIQVSSSGGSSDHGLLAYNFLKQTSLKIATIGMGNVDSAAIMLFAAGEKRISVPSCRFLIHEATATINGQFNATKLKEIVEITNRINEEYYTVISKVCSTTLSSIKSKIKNSKVMSSEEAKKLGLVTEITDKPYLSDFNQIPIIGINNPQNIIQPLQSTII